jgi:rhodanese-related sulfurtransferase
VTLLAAAPWPRRLGIAAAVLGALAPFAGSPYAARHGRVDVEALARAVEHEDDHVTAVELARWIRERHASLRIVDVRTEREYDDYHIPGAERIPLGALADTPFRTDETVVLYSEGGAHAAQGWVFLRALGHTNVFFLRGGLSEWLDDVMTPTLPAAPTAAESAQFDSVAALSRYFGGVPQRDEPEDGSRKTEGSQKVGTGVPKTGVSSTANRVQRLRKRGC